jgi:hypothetical protein
LKAVQKYLLHYAEPEARELPLQSIGTDWRQVLVTPAYSESGTLTKRLHKLAADTPGLLQVLVLNRPDSDTNLHCNDELRAALSDFPTLEKMPQCHSRLLHVAKDSHLLLVERPLALPAAKGVGLARKIGCDIALAMGQAGGIRSQWIHCTDADAELPPEYFKREYRVTPGAIAISHPFVHVVDAKQSLPATMALYELRLHHYRRGLLWAGSPYAFHSLGSCISVAASAYAQVRGFPRRAGAEDFYLLNKLAKTGTVDCPAGQAIKLSARHSTRVPFGTGPAVARLAGEALPESVALFYHPTSFAALRSILRLVATLFDNPQPMAEIRQQLADWPTAFSVLEAAGIRDCLDHCAQHARNVAQYQRHFNQWFDGFRSLKFLHALRDRGLPDLNLEQSLEAGDFLWPHGSASLNAEEILESCRQDLGWTAAW